MKCIHILTVLFNVTGGDLYIVHVGFYALTSCLTKGQRESPMLYDSDPTQVTVLS